MVNVPRGEGLGGRNDAGGGGGSASVCHGVSGGGDALGNSLFAAYLSMVGITAIGERSDTVSGFVP